MSRRQPKKAANPVRYLCWRPGSVIQDSDSRWQVLIWIKDSLFGRVRVAQWRLFFLHSLRAKPLPAHTTRHT
jgi:hypothetical protein